MKLTRRSVVPAVLVSLLTFACSSDGDGGTKEEEKQPYPAPAPDDCITDVTPGHQKLHCEDLDFDLTVPESCVTAQCKFLVDVHGFGMNGDVQDLHTKFRDIATARNYIVLQPSAPGSLLTAAWAPANDAQVFALMNRVKNVWHVDEKHIHFGGYSMGGWMTWRFLCNHADIIASAAPISAGSSGPGQSCAFSGDEMPSREVPVFYTHGHTDGLVNFSTATTMVDSVKAAWSLEEKSVVGHADDYDWTRYESPSGTPFEFAQHDWETAFVLGTIALKGHCFPGSDQVVGCGLDNAFVWGEKVLDFYEAHPLP